MDETGQKIIDATMALIRDKGYMVTTSKDIAAKAGVNECTLFRKFKSKKDIALSGIAQEKWRGDVTPAAFSKIVWDLKTDLTMFMTEYMNRITPDFVNLSIGLRAPQLYEEVAPYILKIPEAFLSSLVAYFRQMHEKGKMEAGDFKSLAMTIFSATFGFTFLKASFKKALTEAEKEQYIESSVELFVNGIEK